MSYGTKGRSAACHTLKHKPSQVSRFAIADKLQTSRNVSKFLSVSLAACMPNNTWSRHDARSKRKLPEVHGDRNMLYLIIELVPAGTTRTSRVHPCQSKVRKHLQELRKEAGRVCRRRTRLDCTFDNEHRGVLQHVRRFEVPSDYNYKQKPLLHIPLPCHAQHVLRPVNSRCYRDSLLKACFLPSLFPCLPASRSDSVSTLCSIGLSLTSTQKHSPISTTETDRSPV